jgi:hypothetical protein
MYGRLGVTTREDFYEIHTRCGCERICVYEETRARIVK